MGTLFNSVQHLLDVLGASESGQAFLDMQRRFGLVRDEMSGTPYWESDANGIAFEVEDGTIDTVFLFGNGKDGFETYSAGLVAGLTFASSRADVRAALGEPVQSEGPQHLATDVHNGGWDKFAIDRYFFHFTYAARDGVLELLTMTLVTPKS